MTPQSELPIVNPVQISEERGVRILSFRRDATGSADLDHVRSWFALHFRQEVPADLRLVIDLAGVATLDSACLGPLVLKFKEMQQARGRMALTGVESHALREVFALTRFDKVFPIYKTRDEALAAVAG
jgi:anti-anti-sigma factor